MTNSLLIALVLVSPPLLGLGAWLLASRLRRPMLDRSFDFVQLRQRVAGIAVTPRQVLKVAALCLPFILFDWIGVVSVNLVIYGISGYVLLKFVSRNSSVPNQTQEVLAELEATAATLNSTRWNVERMVQLVSEKSTELERKERQRQELEQVISKRLKESEAYKSFNEEQRNVLLLAVRQSQRRGTLGTIGIVLGSIALNLAATLIWTLWGNPGRNELIEKMDRLAVVLHLAS